MLNEIATLIPKSKERMIIIGLLDFILATFSPTLHQVMADKQNFLLCTRTLSLLSLYFVVRTKFIFVYIYPAYLHVTYVR